MSKSIQDTMQAMVDYYSHEDYHSMYGQVLLEDIECYGVERLMQNSETHFEVKLTFEQCDVIIDEILKNLEEYTTDYSNYWVGTDSIGGVSFGENEEEIPQGFNREEDDDCGFYIPDEGDYMYYDMSSSGLNVKLTEHDCYEVLKEIEKNS